MLKKILHRYMSGKIFPTPEVWENVLTQTIKSPIPRTKVKWSIPYNWKKADKSHKWKEGVQKNVQFSFRRQTKAFRYEVVFRGIQPCFCHGGALALFWTRALKRSYRLSGSVVMRSKTGTSSLSSQFVFRARKMAPSSSR